MGRKPVAAATKAAADRLRLRVLSIEQALASCAAGELDFDLGLSVLYWRRLKGAFLDVPRHGIINLHPAPLPEYKGVGGYNLGILEGLEEWAVSAHYVDESIDTGPIVATRSFAIDPNRETARSLEKTSMLELEALFEDVWTEYVGQPRRLRTRTNIGGRHLTRRQLEDMKRIDLEQDDIARKVRAFWFPPYDGAFIEIAGQRYTLVDRVILESLAEPGTSSLFSPSSGSES
jgi:methionyl-tRNA formyltransferase